MLIFFIQRDRNINNHRHLALLQIADRSIISCIRKHISSGVYYDLNTYSII